MVIFVVYEFMADNPFLEQNKFLAQVFIFTGLDVKVDSLKEPTDVANLMRYAIKSANHRLTKQATQAFMRTNPTTVFL